MDVKFAVLRMAWLRRGRMNCVVIMPFAPEFDDVYGAIKQAVESVASARNSRCVRLDDERPAGRITDRILETLRSCDLCIADITGARPNVMWELGYAMALGKPAIIVAQDPAPLPFDIHDMQKVKYTRDRLLVSLTSPLHRVVIDTLSAMSSDALPAKVQDDQARAINSLLDEVSDLKRMVFEVVGAWRGSGFSSTEVVSDRSLRGMIGHWKNVESGSHAYTRIVRGELVTPYCFRGNERLTGLYYGWRHIGDYWFARYRWIGSDIAGFSFLKLASPDSLVGAWWSSEDEVELSETPPKFAGVSAKWIRIGDSSLPEWADDTLREIESEGLASYFARQDAKRSTNWM